MAHAPLPSLFNTIKQNFLFVQLFYCSSHSFYVVVHFIFTCHPLSFITALPLQSNGRTYQFMTKRLMHTRK